MSNRQLQRLADYIKDCSDTVENDRSPTALEWAIVDLEGISENLQCLLRGEPMKFDEVRYDAVSPPPSLRKPLCILVEYIAGSLELLRGYDPAESDGIQAAVSDLRGIHGDLVRLLHGGELQYTRPDDDAEIPHEVYH